MSAEAGLKQPLKWIRHLDEGTPPPQSAPSSQIQPAGNGYVTTGPAPVGLLPAQTLSAQEQRENFEFLCQAIDETYAAFELKHIEWNDVCRRYRQQLKPGLSTDGFYRLLFGLVNELKDTHSWLQNYRVSPPSSGQGLVLELFEDKPFVVGVDTASEAAELGIKPGAEVIEIDGFPVADRIEKVRPGLRAFSSERAFRREASRYLLAGERGTTLGLKLRFPDGQVRTCALRRTTGLGTRTPSPCAFHLDRQHFLQFGRHPSGLGYIRITSFEGREELAHDFDKALAGLRTSPGLILDVRDNPGGYGPQYIVGRFLKTRTLGAIGFVKRGPGHGDLQRRE